VDKQRILHSENIDRNEMQRGYLSRFRAGEISALLFLLPQK